jgi:ribosomal protein S18 acetylase RimI-like enzyme
VDIRRAEHDEIAAAISVWATANRRPPSGGHADRLRSWSEQDGARLFIVVDDESRVVGTLLCLLGREADGAGDVVPGLRHITGLAVQPEYQGAGLGRRLLRATIADARSDGITRVTLWTHTHNRRAIHLLESLGFQPTGRTMLDEHGAMLVLLELLVI